MCDCIKRVEKMLNERMVKENPGCKIIEGVQLTNAAIMFHTGKSQLFSPALGKYAQGERTRKYAPNMYYSYCPFCGEKYDTK